MIEAGANALGIGGVALVLITFLLVQREQMNARSSPYLLFNMAGCLLIGVSLFVSFNLPSAIIQGCWFLISGYGLARNLAAGRAARAMPFNPTWRPMTDADLDGVVAVARIAFPDHVEDRDCFAERLALYPAGCRVVTNAAGGVVGYGIVYPWVEGSMPPLNATIGALPRDASLLYLHDLALLPEARGSGAARRFVGWLVDHARAEGWPRIALVAVNDAAPFWERQGFAGLDSPALRAKLAGYGADARYMVRALPPSDILHQPPV